ncbi:hypothetical protein ACIRPT_05650 [Streptomyces sp. NPDC101227]|uniref:hypothetical protein n=1 Tax=Streptomyces sp. NPDC101227 TaxID=3366136 RepID=UPI0037F8F12B
MSAAGESYAECTERKVVNFHLRCIAALLPYHVRLAALEAWHTVDPSLFLMDHGPPAAVVERVL